MKLRRRSVKNTMELLHVDIDLMVNTDIVKRTCARRVITKALVLWAVQKVY